MLCVWINERIPVCLSSQKKYELHRDKLLSDND